MKVVRGHKLASVALVLHQTLHSEGLQCREYRSLAESYRLRDLARHNVGAWLQLALQDLTNDLMVWHWLPILVLHD